MDLQLHDTYFVLSPSAVFLGMAFSLALFATTYYVLPASPRAAGWHFWVTTVGLAAFWMSFYLWGHVLIRHATAQADPGLELGLGIAFFVSGLILLGSVAMFAVNVLVTLLARLR